MGSWCLLDWLYWCYGLILVVGWVVRLWLVKFVGWILNDGVLDVWINGGRYWIWNYLFVYEVRNLVKCNVLIIRWW